MPFPMNGRGDMVLALMFPTVCDALSGRLGLDHVRAPMLAEPEKPLISLFRDLNLCYKNILEKLNRIDDQKEGIYFREKKRELERNKLNKRR